MPWPPSNAQLDVVRNYLKGEFPALQIDERYEDAQMVHRFRLIDKGNPEHELQLRGRSLFEDEADIGGILRRNHVAGRMRESGVTPVQVGKFSGEVTIS
jgi:hypothetical protein